MSLGVWLLALAVVTPEPSGVRSSRAEAYHAYLMAKQAAADADYPAALDAYRRAHELDPDSAIVVLELSEVNARLRRYKEAVAWARKASRLDPASEEAWRLLARLYELLDREDDKIASLRSLVEAVPDRPEHRLRLAEAMRAAGRPDEAEQILLEAHELNPADADTALALADLYVGRGRLDRAMEVLGEAARANPEDVPLRARLAELYLGTEDRTRARETLLELARAASSDVSLLVKVAKALREQPLNDHAAAAQVYRLAVAAAPGDPVLRLSLATSLMRAGAVLEARAAFEDVLERLEPDQPAARVSVLRRLAAIELDLGRDERAVELLREADSLTAPDDWELTLFLARTLESQGDHRGALEATGRRLAEHSPEELEWRPLWLARTWYLILDGQLGAGMELWRTLAEQREPDLEEWASLLQALLRAGREREFEQQRAAALEAYPGVERQLTLGVTGWLVNADRADLARQQLRELLVRYPRDLELHMALAQLYQREQDWDAALELLLGAQQVHPEDADLRFQLGAVYERQQRYQEAERELQRAIDLEPDHAPALNYLGYTWAELGIKLEQAVELIERALEREPDSGAYLDSLGWAYHKLGRNQEAERALKRALEHLDDDAVVHAHLGDVYQAQGRSELAREAWNRALSLDPDEELRDELEQKLAQPVEPPAGDGPAR